MRSRSKRVFFGKYVFSVDETVYEPAEDSFLFAENLHVKQSEQVLDVGTGCGLLALIAAERAAEVVGVDINPHAIRCAKENAEFNNAHNISFIQGDLFSPLSNFAKFDLILFNAPYLPIDDTEPDSWTSRAWSGGHSGRETIDKFIAQTTFHLRRMGRILLLQSNIAGIEKTLRAFESYGMRAEIVAERSVPFFESLVLVQARF